MPTNLQVANAVGATAQHVKDGTGNASALAISSDKVGIGTATPGTKLDIKGDVSTFNGVALSLQNLAGGNSNIWVLGTGGRDVPIDAFSIGDASNHKLTILANGNVGIGTTSPGDKLHIKGPLHVDLSDNGGGRLVVFSNLNDNKVFIEGFSSDGDGSASEVLITGRFTEALPLFTVVAKISRFVGDIETSGDIRLTNADCAEEFDICGEEQLEPGTVMVLCDEGKLQPSHTAYDKRVAGVISGAGDYKPGIVLDKQHAESGRQPIGLMGKVFCKVDAHYGEIEIGDLLTTAPTPGFAMKASDPLKAFGAVIGKALRPLAKGQGLIPILVALQ